MGKQSLYLKKNVILNFSCYARGSSKSSNSIRGAYPNGSPLGTNFLYRPRAF